MRLTITMAAMAATFITAATANPMVKPGYWRNVPGDKSIKSMESAVEMETFHLYNEVQDHSGAAEIIHNDPGSAVMMAKAMRDKFKPITNALEVSKAKINETMTIAPDYLTEEDIRRVQHTMSELVKSLVDIRFLQLMEHSSYYYNHPDVIPYRNQITTEYEYLKTLYEDIYRKLAIGLYSRGMIEGDGITRLVPGAAFAKANTMLAYYKAAIEEMETGFEKGLDVTPTEELMQAFDGPFDLGATEADRSMQVAHEDDDEDDD
ncbi:hypothetical protein K402DRAFT_458160 [Aulographum hederae CBS 113979]|uniref:Uncharacterized protein n=1 Tax=Aulographum hederae CBS 113979 TaxID=1176131 RepID=A0A6G1GKH2_9PEZI|nr:hypothetical protein K402DRAFT_458160 [Aulographum hederae CBS 113979]